MGVARTVAKNTYFNFIATASDVLVTLTVSIVLARSFGPEQYGVYALLMWVLTLAVMISELGLVAMAKRFVAEALGKQNTGEVQGLLRLTMFVRGGAALAVFLVILVFSGFLSRLFEDSGNRIHFVFLAFMFLPYALNLTFIGIFGGFQRYEYRSYISLGSNLPRALAVISLAVLGFGIEEVLIANIAAWVIGVFIALFLLRRLIPLKALISSSSLQSAPRKRALKYALTFTAILGVNYIIWRQLEVLFLGLWGSPEDVAFYRLAGQLPSMVMLLIPAMFAAVLLPAVSEQFGRGDMDKIRAIYLTSARYVMILALPLAAAGIALARPVISLLWGTDYEPAVLLMQILFIPFAFRAIADSVTAVIYGVNEPSFVLKVGLILAVLSIGLNVWLIPTYGVLGAAIGSSVPRFLVLPIYIRFASTKTGAQWPLGDTARIALASSIMGVVLFALQNSLGITLGLALSIPLGIVLYAAALLVFKAIRRQDLETLKGVQNSLPHALRKNYIALIGLAERVVR